MSALCLAARLSRTSSLLLVSHLPFTFSLLRPLERRVLRLFMENKCKQERVPEAAAAERRDVKRRSSPSVSP